MTYLLTYLYHRLRGSGSTVVTMTSKVNGKMEISTPCRSETIKNIESKIGQNDYVVHPFNPTNFCRNRSEVVCSPYSWNITLLWLGVPLLPLFLSSPTAKADGRIFTIYTSKDADSPKDVPFEGFDDKKCSVYQNPVTPKKWAWIIVDRQVQAKRKKNWIFNIFETISQINNEVWQDT